MIRTFRHRRARLLLDHARGDPDRRLRAVGTGRPRRRRVGAGRCRPHRPAPAPASRVWRADAAEELLRYVEGIGEEGLDPASLFARPAARGARRRRSGRAQPRSPARLPAPAADLSGGSVRGRQPGRMAHARQQPRRRPASSGCWPRCCAGRRRRGARRAAADPSPICRAEGARSPATPAEDDARRELIRANMERWRWMPRNLGARHVIVNVPAFTAALWSRTAGSSPATAPSSARGGRRRRSSPRRITAVTINPWWNVPQSIIRENGRPVRRRLSGHPHREGGISVRQPPGPRNALGRLKIEMPNEHAIYLHDTPAQALFGRPVRAFSHGCIRTQNVRDFAALLLAPTGEWDRAAIDRRRSRTGRNQPISLAAADPGLHRLFHRGGDQRRRHRHLCRHLRPRRAGPPGAEPRRRRRPRERQPTRADGARPQGTRRPASAGCPAEPFSRRSDHAQRPVTQSYWNATAPASAFPRSTGDIEVDVAIIGGGIVGVTTARLLKDRGLRVALVEARAGRRGGDRQVDRQDHLAAQYRLHQDRAEVRRGRRARLCRGQRGRPRTIVELAGAPRHRLRPRAQARLHLHARRGRRSPRSRRRSSSPARLGLPASLTRDTGLPFDGAGGDALGRPGPVPPGQICEGARRDAARATAATSSSNRG